ncbi:hypothetical protein IW261DRAFT_1483750 [Armillaria novae-zelandiae]|uniref:Extracellular membrane protein CFEM domain-containing protein n=1 Tax=Armillaria novae-zelandiae TaxID=153914 RepID=A0AA39P7E9_9AGAR|nr:hypothetical protein IW261DRAFT_1483750 [Armillaria novae-zelandiae]
MALSLTLVTLLLLSCFGCVNALLNKWEATSFCKCICFQSNYSIQHLDFPDNPSQPCLSCTKQWCLNQNLRICAGASLGDTDPDTATGKEGDVEARCFQRDSPRDQLVVTLFLLTVFGLLLGAGIKSRMIKAGIDTSVPWNAGRRWWEMLIYSQDWTPRRQFQELGLSRFGSSWTVTGRGIHSGE